MYIANLPIASDPGVAALLERFSQAPVSYNRSLQEAQADNISRWRTAYDTLIAAVYSAQQQSRKHLDDVQRTHLTALQEASSKPDALREQEQAYRNYVEMLNRAHQETLKQYTDAANAYAAAVAQVGQETRAQWVDGYRNYLQTLKDAWVSLDVGAAVQAMTRIPGGG